MPAARTMSAAITTGRVEMYRWETVAQSDRVIVGYKKLRYFQASSGRTVGFVF